MEKRSMVSIYKELILLEMKKSIQKSIIEEIAENFETNKEDEQNLL